MSLVFAAPATVVVPVSDGSLYPVRRVYLVGRNYADHAREMGFDPDREPPFFFTKWADTVMANPKEIAYPPKTQNYHFEAELVVALGKGGRDISADEAAGHIFGYATGLDMTRRDLQIAAREKGRPWDTGKNVDQSAPIGTLHPLAETGELREGAIWLEVNGERRQAGDLDQLIWSVAEMIAILSELYELAPGDLIYTGTPAGVGPVVPGDRIRVHVDGLTDLDLKIV